MKNGEETGWRRVVECARSRLVRLCAAATVLVGIASLSGFLAAWAWPFELLCHFRVQYSILFLVIAVAMGLCRSFRWSGAAILLAAANAWQVVPYFMPPPPRSGSPPRPLRVVSVNLFSGNSDPEAALRFLGESRADVIAAYEVTPAWAARMALSLDGYPYRRIHPAVGNFGIAVYSRRPFVSARSHSLSENNLAIEVVMLHEGDEVHLFAAHAYPPGGRRTELRDRQLKSLGDVAESISGPLVIVGDLNTTPFSPSFRELCESGRVHDLPCLGAGVQPTWPAGRPLLSIPIDHCLVSEHWEGYVSTGPEIGSDHLPLRVYLEAW